jgi:hypothetical protein
VKTPRADEERRPIADFQRPATSFFNMTPHHDPVLFRQLPVIQKIIDDETWLEGERRGHTVSADDVVVRERVCEIVLRVGGSYASHSSGRRPRCSPVRQRRRPRCR